MSDRSLLALLSVYLLFAALVLGDTSTAPPRLRSAEAATVDCVLPEHLWIERVGQGLRCISRDEARLVGLRPGDTLDERGVLGRMAPSRVAMVEAPISLNAASEAEIASLPGVGLQLSRALIAGRPYHHLDEVGDVPGVGRRRLRMLLARFYLDGEEPGLPVAGADLPGR